MICSSLDNLQNISISHSNDFVAILLGDTKVGLDIEQISDKNKAALVIPDLAVPGGNENSPAFLVFDNYEKILKWNRSLRFGVSVCTLSNMIKNEI